MRRPIRHYGDLPGSPPSVTSILEAGFPKPALMEWKIRTTAQLARDYPDEPIGTLLARHGPRGDVRGTAVHKLIELHLSGTPTEPDDSPAGVYYGQWRRWWEDSGFTVPGQTEMMVCSDVPFYAGTADYLDEDGRLWDWKTATNLPERPWLDHVAQLAAYEHAIGPGLIPNLVYISSTGVRHFEITEDERLRGAFAFSAAYDIASVLYPDEMGAQLCR